MKIILKTLCGCVGSMDISMGSSPHQYVYVPLYKPLDVKQNVDPIRIEYDNIKKKKVSSLWTKL